MIEARAEGGAVLARTGQGAWRWPMAEPAAARAGLSGVAAVAKARPE